MGSGSLILLFCVCLVYVSLSLHRQVYQERVQIQQTNFLNFFPPQAPPISILLMHFAHYQTTLRPVQKHFPAMLSQFVSVAFELKSRLG